MKRPLLGAVALLLTLSGPVLALSPLEEPAEARRGTLQLVPRLQVLLGQGGPAGADFNVALELYKLLPIINPYLMGGLAWRGDDVSPMLGVGARPTFVTADGVGDVYLDLALGYQLSNRLPVWRFGVGYRLWPLDFLGFGFVIHYVAAPDPLAPRGLGIGFDFAWNLGRSESSTTKRRR